MWVIIGWILQALFHSLLCFFIPYLTFFIGGMALPDSGFVIEHEIFGYTVFTCVIIVVSLKVFNESGSWTLLHHLSIWLSILMWFATASVYAVMYPAVAGIFEPGQGLGVPDFRTMFRGGWFQFYNATSNILFWLTVLLVVGTALAKDILWKSIVHNVPGLRKLYHHIQDLEAMREKIYPEVAKRIGARVCYKLCSPTRVVKHGRFTDLYTDVDENEMNEYKSTISRK